MNAYDIDKITRYLKYSKSVFREVAQHRRKQEAGALPIFFVSARFTVTIAFFFLEFRSPPYRNNKQQQAVDSVDTRRPLTIRLSLRLLDNTINEV